MRWKLLVEDFSCMRKTRIVFVFLFARMECSMRTIISAKEHGWYELKTVAPTYIHNTRIFVLIFHHIPLVSENVSSSCKTKLTRVYRKQRENLSVSSLMFHCFKEIYLANHWIKEQTNWQLVKQISCIVSFKQYLHCV